jgi:hypothetical protein
MTGWIYAGAASLLIVATGLMHGAWTDRWARSADITEAAARLPEIPMTLGTWEGKDLEPGAGSSLPGIAGSLRREYTDRRRGVRVVIALVAGRPGPVATHTPEACYGANGYFVGPKKVSSLPGGAKFWYSEAVKTRETDEARLRIYWAWNGGTGWVAAADARQELPRWKHPVLHKLYVVRDLSQASGDTGPDACEELLKELLPAMQRALFSHSQG